MDLVVGDVDQPGTEETSPANSQHDTDVVRGQIMVIAVDILDLHSFFDIQSSVNGQTEKIMIIFRYKYFTGTFVLPKKHDEENQEISYLTYHGGLVVFLVVLLLFIQQGLIVNLVVIQNTGE